MKNYQITIAIKVQSQELSLETSTQEILALSKILLIKPEQGSSLFEEHIPRSTTAIISQMVKEKFHITNCQLDTHKKTALEDALSYVRSQSTSLKVASKRLSSILSDDISQSTQIGLKDRYPLKNL